MNQCPCIGIGLLEGNADCLRVAGPKMTAHKAGVRLPDALPQMEEQIAFGKLKLISDTPASATIVAAERPERRGLCSKGGIHPYN